MKYFSQGLNENELKKKYRELANELHPDKANLNPEKEYDPQAFVEMAFEYQNYFNPKKKEKKYEYITISELEDLLKCIGVKIPNIQELLKIFNVEVPNWAKNIKTIPDFVKTIPIKINKNFFETFTNLIMKLSNLK